jgi:bacterioferritin (cytochrome b1)
MAGQPLTLLTADEILAGLQKALRAERQAVADYHAHARATDRPQIREAFETLRQVEEDHALRLARRITALGGTPATHAPDTLPAGQTLAQHLAHDLAAEQWAIVEYARLVAGIADDQETVELMTELLLDEIRHARWLKATLRTIQAERPAG